MATRLHQILALARGNQTHTEAAITRVYHDAQRTDRFGGLIRVYAARDEDGERLPQERKTVQLDADQLIARAVEAWTAQADLMVTKDATNQIAKASVIVDGTVVVADVPVATLLYLEKVLQNVRTFVLSLPVLDPEVDWGSGPDAATGLWKSAPEETVRTKKVPKSFVKAWPTKDHPNIVPQVDTYTEDVIVGTWTKTLFSGALPAGRKTELLGRVDRLAAAVKVAREYANQADVVDRRIGSAIFEHLFTIRG